MLIYSDLSITQIAMELGYSSSQHFATQFKNISGTSPNQYRRDYL
jgi:AraC-like DNA-binding protein